VRDTLADLAGIGALRGPSEHENFIGRRLRGLDRVVRMTMNDAFNHLVDRKLVQDTATNRREFINRVGQYNARLQGPLVAALRSSGIGPFATAGYNFFREAYRRASGSAGVKAVNSKAAVRLRIGQIAAALGGLIVTPAILNWLFTHDKKNGGFFGRPGTPIGAVDLGYDDNDGKPMTLDLARWFGLRRALRSTGLGAVIRGAKQGKSAMRIADDVVRDVANALISPAAGPIVRTIGLALTGSPTYIGGRSDADRAAPGESQQLENVKAAAKEFNPLVGTMFKGYGEQGGEGAYDVLRGQVPGLTPTPGYRPELTKGSKAEELAREIFQQGGFEDMRTDEQKERARLRREYAKSLEAKETGAHSKMVKDKRLTGRDKDIIRERVKLGPLLYDVKHMNAEQAMQVWEAAQDDDTVNAVTMRKLTQEVREKIGGSHTLTPQRRREMRGQLNSQKKKPQPVHG
jgi:hypothetical protein